MPNDNPDPLDLADQIGEIARAEREDEKKAAAAREILSKAGWLIDINTARKELAHGGGGVEGSFDEGFVTLEFSRISEVAVFESADEALAYVADMETRLGAHVNSP